MRKTVIAVCMLALLGLGAGAAAQDVTPTMGTHPGTPPPGALCATPVAEASGTPKVTMIASAEASAPVGSPIGLYPCETPAGT